MPPRAGAGPPALRGETAVVVTSFPSRPWCRAVGGGGCGGGHTRRGGYRRCVGVVNSLSSDATVSLHGCEPPLWRRGRARAGPVSARPGEPVGWTGPVDPSLPVPESFVRAHTR